MGQPTQMQPWKLNKAVTDFMATHAQAGTSVEPPKGRANFYPQGAIMFNGGQGAGDGGNQVIFDTEKPKETDGVWQVIWEYM